MPVPRIRQAFLKFARAHPLFDGRHCALLVTDCTASTVELTCQISVTNGMDVIQATSDVREAMVEFIFKSRQQAAVDGATSGQGSGGSSATIIDDPANISQHRSYSPPPPPLTKEDMKLGDGSKTYQTYTSVDYKEMQKYGDKNATAAVTATGRSLQLDHVQVDVDDPAPNGNGLTRRSVRDMDGGSTLPIEWATTMAEMNLVEK